MVMPNAAVDREHYEGFPIGRLSDPVEPLFIQFEGSWDLRRIRPHFFPRAASVVFGSRRNIDPDANEHRILVRQSQDGQTRRGRSLGMTIVRTAGKLQRIDRSNQSSYESFFTQGATLNPRFLL